MGRDIDHAAVAVRAALVEKFSRQNDLEKLEVSAGDKMIVVRDADQVAEGSRDDLLAALRKAQTYAEFWQVSSRPRVH